jgi:hypothetical protein
MMKKGFRTKGFVKLLSGEAKPEVLYEMFRKISLLGTPNTSSEQKILYKRILTG